MGKWGVVQLSARIDFRGQAIDCWNIHLVPPRNWDYTIEHLDEMRDFEQRLKATSGKHVIVAGDFNFSGATLQASAIGRQGLGTPSKKRAMAEETHGPSMASSATCQAFASTTSISGLL